MKKNMFLFSAFVLSCVMVSCTSSEDIDLGEAKHVVNMLSEEPIQLTQEQQAFANSNNGFTLNFLKTVNNVDKSGKSFIYSPLSITYVLGMVNDAATGQTEKELEQTLGFQQGGIQAVNDYCKKLINGLPKVDKDVTLNIANAIFLNKGRTLKKQFAEDVSSYYDATAETLDFKESKKSADVINKWCDDKTNGMIPKILDSTDPSAVSYLLNAIYFKADWASKFDKNNTKEEDFENQSGKIKLPLMHQNVLVNYLRNNVYSAVRIPYGNGLWSMDVMLPEEGKTVDDVIEHLAKYGLVDYDFCGTMRDTYSSYSDTYSAYEVDLKLPRYETESDTDSKEVGGLIPLMKKLGIHLAFDGDFAEIPNMCEEGNVYISLMRQIAKIKVNEEGSEAAAVTVAAENYTTSFTPDPVYPKATFHANKPFVYVIREQSSGVILFVGKFTGK
uniref:Serine protease inhibitor n=1 Tax=Prevotella sp. Sc00033 TaxID=1231729 RepID=W5QTA0_9BACT|nr:serine protease inhibitor [Prevotella sp. Sc00033]